MTYSKIFKWLLAALFVIGVITSAYGFINGWPSDEVWKNDHAKQAELPAVIAAMEEAGVPVMSSSELDAKKAEVAQLTEVAKGFSKRTEEIKAEIDKAGKNKNLKAKLEKEYKAEFDSLANEITKINLQVSEYKQAVELNKHKAELAEVEARIAKGESSVNVIIYATYAMMALVLVSLLVIIIIMNGLNNPMSLVKLLVVVIIVGGLVAGAYALAPGSMIQSETLTPDQISFADLKMTDTVLYLAYLFFGGAIVALVTSWIVGAVRK
jgi:uncharacterized membrane protein YqjE